MEFNGVATRKYTFEYNFARDGGVIGAIPMGVFIPDEALIWFGVAFVTTGLTSGGAATIAVGTDLQAPALIAATAVAVWAINARIPGVDLPAAPVLIDNPAPANRREELQVTIAGAALTAGVFRFTCYGFQQPSVG